MRWLVVISLLIVGACRVDSSSDAEADALSQVECEQMIGWGWCYGECSMLQIDDENCGECGTECPAPSSCSGGRCMCETLQEVCGSSCCARLEPCIDGECAGCTTSEMCGGECCTEDEMCLFGECIACHAEVCDYADNDCDGEVDEDLTRSCDNPCGEGTETCVSGTWAYCTAPEPTNEVCDGEDNDCDGEIDEGC